MAKLPNGSAVGNVANPSEVSYRGDLIPPVTSYASAAANLPMRTRLAIPASTNRTGSPVVSRADRRDGLRYFYSHGGIQMPVPSVPRPGPGGVVSSAYQQVLVQLHDWATNNQWFAAGYPRNLGYSFRAQQLQTKASGGPTSAVMQQKPVFARVQRVPRYSVVPNRYPTRSTRS